MRKIKIFKFFIFSKKFIRSFLGIDDLSKRRRRVSRVIYSDRSSISKPDSEELEKQLKAKKKKDEMDDILDSMVWNLKDGEDGKIIVENENDLLKDIKKIKENTQKEEDRKQEALLLQSHQEHADEKFSKSLLDKKNLMELAWAANFEKYLVEYLDNYDAENSITLGIKIFHLMAEFRVKFTASYSAS